MIALVTGATSGFGKATAEVFARNGFDVIITGRRKEKLEAFAGELKKDNKVEVLTLCFDVQKKAEVEKALRTLTEKWQNIDVLVKSGRWSAWA